MNINISLNFIYLPKNTKTSKMIGVNRIQNISCMRNNKIMKLLMLK